MTIISIILIITGWFVGEEVRCDKQGKGP